MPIENVIAARVGGAAHIEARDATLREIFVALAKHRSSTEVAA